MGEMGENSLPLSRYCQLEVGSTLCDNLRHKTVVEFPTLYVVMREESNISAYKGKVDPAWREASPSQTIPAIILVLQWPSVEIKSMHSTQRRSALRKERGCKKQLRMESRGALEGGEERKSCQRGSSILILLALSPYLGQQTRCK